MVRLAKTKAARCQHSRLQPIEQTKLLPAVRKAMLIALTLPATPCTVERSFSTMRKVKTRLRPTMSGQRLSRLYMLSVLRNEGNTRKTELVKFGRERRVLRFSLNVYSVIFVVLQRNEILITYFNLTKSRLEQTAHQYLFEYFVHDFSILAPRGIRVEDDANTLAKSRCHSAGGAKIFLI